MHGKTTIKIVGLTLHYMPENTTATPTKMNMAVKCVAV
jgi:hypothetical protein